MRSSSAVLVSAVVLIVVNNRLLTLAAPVIDANVAQNANSTENKSHPPSDIPLASLPSVTSSPSAETNESHSQPAATAAVAEASPSVRRLADKDAAQQNDRAPTDDVNELRYDDVDLLLANQNGEEPYESSDDEAMLEQLFSPRQIRNSDDIDVSPKAMAEYLLLTGDFSGVQLAIDDFVSSGLLTPSEADRYKDVVGLEYATMAQQNYLPPREQRASYRLQEPYEVDNRASNVVDYSEYDGNALPSNVLVPVVPADDDDVIQQKTYMPADVETLAQLDSRFLEELLLQQQQQQLAEELDNGNVNRNEEDETQRVSANADDVTADDGETSLEAELDSLPVSEGQAVEHNDNAEEELEQIGKLLRKSSQKQGEQKTDAKQ